MTTLTVDHPPPVPTPAATSPQPGATVGGVTSLLRLEGVVALLASVLAYETLEPNWWLFAALFLVPDLLMLGYLVNRKLGAAVYNSGHTYFMPAALALIGWGLNNSSLFGPALIWVAYIGFDRAMGYGLKYQVAFGATHLAGKEN